MAHIFFASGPSLGHMMRVLPIADQLRKHRSVAIGTDGHRWLEAIRFRGYEPHVLPGVISGAILEGGSAGLADHYIKQAVDADLALLRRLQPRVVVIDWRPSMRLAASILGIPVIAIANVHVTRAYRGWRAAPALHPIVCRVGQHVGDLLMPLLEPIFQRAWARPYQQIARAHGVKGWADLRDYIVGDVTLYPDLPSLMPARSGSGTFIGPLISPPAADGLPALRGPVLCISMGSEDAQRFAPQIVAAVGDWPGDVVVTLGSRTAQGVWPERWIERNYINPAALWAQGHPVVWLYHGGNGSSYQLLQRWVAAPHTTHGAVILPFHVEHQWNAKMMQRLGAASVGALAQRLDDPAQQQQVGHALRTLAAAPLPPPPRRLVQDVQTYQDAVGRAVREIERWL